MSDHKEHALVYHRYGLDPNCRDVWRDIHNPILASIATLRNVNKTLKVYVLDTEPFLENWGGFQKLLDFHIIQQPIQMPQPYTKGCPFQSRIVSRIWDVWNFAKLIEEEVVIYSDCDVMWLRDPIPLSNSPVKGFYGDLRGDGYFYFRTKSKVTEIFVNTWKSLCLAGAMDDDIRTHMRLSKYHSPMYLAEMAYCYMIRNGMRAGWNPVDPLEHYFLDDKNEEVNPHAKCYHCHSGQFGNNRLRVVRRVKEFSTAIRNVLPASHSELLLDHVEADTGFLEIASLFDSKAL